jgi:hypothetical protein
MNTKVIGLACLATLTAPSAWALEKELQVGPDELRGDLELLSQHWSPGASAVINPSATGHVSVDARWYDVGVHLDGYGALDGNPGGDKAITDFETTEVTGRIDYLFEVENIVQVLPFVEATVYPYAMGKTKYNWVGAEGWYMTPAEGLEVGASIQYNVADNTIDTGNEHYWVHNLGARYIYQEAPLDFQGWGLLGMANRAYHRQMTGADIQGATTLDLGGQLTLPLPWTSTWTFLKVDNYWYVRSDDRHELAKAGRDKTELVFSIGFEYSPQ